MGRDRAEGHEDLDLGEDVLREDGRPLGDERDADPARAAAADQVLNGAEHPLLAVERPLRGEGVRLVEHQVERRAVPVIQRLREVRQQVQHVETGAPAAFEAAFATMIRGRAEALLIINTAFLADHKQRLLDLALRHRLPTVSYGRSFAEAGSLLTLGTDVRELCQRSAVFVHKILRGATPADLPIERVDKFPLVVNLQTAQALGLTLSPPVLVRADEVLK